MTTLTKLNNWLYPFMTNGRKFIETSTLEQEAIEIDYNGEKIQVDGIYTEAELSDWDTPGTPADFEIDKVFYKGVEITSILTFEQFGELTKKVLNKLK